MSRIFGPAIARRLYVITLTLGVGALLCATEVAEAENGDTTAATRIEEIVVTATRREQNIQSVPLSVYVVTDDTLRGLGATAFADYARTVPGLSYTDGGTGGEKQTIRGISSNPWSETNSGTAIYLDEVPITNAGGTVGPPFNPDPVLVDIERIEVLKGPQGTLFGAAAMGGAIRLITNTPDPDAITAEIDAAVTSTKDGETGYGLHVMANLPIDAVRGAFRAAVYQRDLGGFIDNVLDGRKDVDNRELTGARLTGLIGLSDRATATARVAYQNRESRGLSAEEPGVGKRKQSRIPEAIADEWTNYNVVFDVGFDWGSLVSSTSYLDRDVDTMADVSFFLSLFFGLDNPLTVVNEEQVSEFIQEFRLVSTSENRFDWLAGMFYQDQDQELSQDFPSPGFDALTDGLASMFGPPDNLFVRREEFALQQLAIYAELAYQLTEKLELTAGGRWYDIDRDYRADNRGLLFVMGELEESFSTGDSGITPMTSLSYALRDEWMLYATVSEGFRPGGINPPGAVSEPSCAMELEALGFNTTPTSYESDSLVNYELGTRFHADDGRLRISAVAYHIEWSDMQTMKFLDCGVGFLENAGKADSDGVELEFVVAPTDGLELFLVGSYNSAELSEDVPNLNGMKGDRLPGVPRVTARAGVSYAFPVLSNRSVFVSADLQHVGNSWMEFNRSSSRELPAYTVGNLRLGLESGSWSVSFFVNNVADEAATVFINDNVLGEWLTPIRPRTVGINVNWRL